MRAPLVFLPLSLSLAACAPDFATTVPRANLGGRLVIGVATTPVIVAASPAPLPSESVAPVPTSEPEASVAPAASPSPSPEPSMTPTPVAASGGGGQGGGGRVVPQAVLLVDEAGAPVVGASFRLGDGTTGVTDGNGALGLMSTFAGDRITVSAPGFMTSEVFDLPFTDTLHLRRAGGLSAPFNQRTTSVSGAMIAPPGFIAGLASYSDALGTAGNPVAVDPDGTFDLSITTNRAGEPVGTLAAVAGDGLGGLLLGVSAGFRPFVDPAPPAFQMALANRTITFSSVVPPGLTQGDTRLELHPLDAPRVIFDRTLSQAGTFTATPDGTLPGATWRVTLAATDLTGSRESVASARPVDDRADLTLLTPTAVTVDSGARQVAWTAVAGARGYRVEVSASNGGAVWEAFTTTGGAVTVPEERWPAAGGVVMVEAIDAPNLVSRSLASLPDGPRRLRIEPWLNAETYRVATTRVAI